MSDQPQAPQPSSSRDIPTPIVREMQDSYLTYAMSVIMARALPDVRDGLKPSQRRILVAMHDLNLHPRAKHRKCALICGETMGKYHPHGEGVIYPTLVRLGQEWAMRHTLVDPQGNFGSIDNDPPAAMRYTEARMAGPAEEMLADLDKETVNFEENYDATRTEPVVLPSRFPNLLVNGSEGIAVGMATRLVPHNLGEICDAIIAVIDNPEITLDELMQIVPGPDFPTGAEICGAAGIRSAYMTGRGSMTVRAIMHTEELKNGRMQIVVDEIPYGVLLPTIKDRVVEAVQNGTIKGIDELRDESGRDQMVRYVVVLKKDANVQVVMNQLYEYTPLQSSIHVINTALINRMPKTLSLKQLIQHYIDHRVEVVRRRTSFLLRKARQRAHILEGLILAVADIDEIIAIIRSSPDVDTARTRLMARALRLSEQATVIRLLPEVFVNRVVGEDQSLTRPQADAILAMQLRRLTGLEIEQLANEYSKLAEEIADYEMILANNRLVLDIIAEDMREMKEKYADQRRTRISGEVGDRNIDELIEREDVIVTISHEGYIKRVPADTYRAQGRGGRGIRGTDAKEGDFIEHLHVANTHDYMLFFTNRGRVYWLRVYDIPSAARTARGRALANVLTMLPSERHMAVLPVQKFEERYVFFCTEKGTVKKTPLSAFSNPRPSGIQAIQLDPDDSLIGVGLTTGEDQIVIGTRNGMACRFFEEDVRPMGRTARGVRGISLGGDDRVIDMAVFASGSQPAASPSGPQTPSSATQSRDRKEAGPDESSDDETVLDQDDATDEATPDRAGEAALSGDADASETRRDGVEPPRPSQSVLTVCERGFGKRTDLDEYRLTRRGGKGVINMRVTDKTGPVVALRSVTDQDALMLITSKGTLLKMTIDQLREIGRATQGVRLIRVEDEDDRVVAVAKVVTEKEENGDSSGGRSESAAEPPGSDGSAPETPE